MAKISYVIPCYYNERNIPYTTTKLMQIERQFKQKGLAFEYVFVDDGSKDNTYDALIDFQKSNPSKVKIIKLTRNFGSLNAILAGLHYTTGDCNVFISADLQDPPELIPKMFDYWNKGIKLVVANREKRSDKFLNSLFANLYHKMIKKIAVTDVPSGGFDLVLFDEEIKKLILDIKEKNTNIFYLITWLGYDYVNIPYHRRKREIGTSKWTLQKKIKLLIDSFVAFTFLPIRIISILGILLGLSSILYGIFIVISFSMGMIEVKGWTATMVIILMLGSFQMIALGIIGEYIWRTLDASRARPSFVVKEIIDETKDPSLY